MTTGIEDIILDDTSYQLISNDTLPLYTQYDGDLEDFLNSEEGSVWRDTIIPGVKQNYCAVKLMLTDQLNSMYWFNTGDASILEGRMPPRRNTRRERMFA